MTLRLWIGCAASLRGLALGINVVCPLPSVASQPVKNPSSCYLLLLTAVLGNFLLGNKSAVACLGRSLAAYRYATVH